MKQPQSDPLTKLKMIRRISLIVWLVLSVALLLAIQYANVHVEWQGTVTNIVRAFIVASLADAGYHCYLSKKIRALQQTES